MLRTTHTFLCDAVHHWAKHQDVCAAVGASAQAAVAAQTCGAKHCQATDTLMIIKYEPCNSPSLVLAAMVSSHHTSSQRSRDGSAADLLRGPEPVSK